MPNAHEQVEALLEEMRERAKDPIVGRLAEQVSLICRGYMEPAEKEALPGVRLTPNEASLFRLLKARLGRAVSRNALLDVASFHHGWDKEPMPKIVDVYICRLRRKLIGSGFGIETAWGHGYRLVKRPVAARAA
jgi:DNA-binding response OmpR family regulator